MAAHADRGHARLAPSAAYRWIACPGSIRESAGIEDKPGVFADEGTAAHTLAELCLRENLDAIDFLGGSVDVVKGAVSRGDAQGPRVFAVDEEMVDAVQIHLDEVRRLVEPGDEVEYEAQLNLSHIPGMDSGTGDCTIYKPASCRLVVVDYKHGRGVPVEVKSNPQLLTYALGLSQRYHNRGVEEVEIVVVQPRCPHPDGPVRREVVPVLDLIEFRATLAEAAERTMSPDAPLNAGDWCKFCPAAHRCSALRQRVLATAEMEFGGEPPTADGMTPGAMAAVLGEVSVVKDWIKRVEERAHQMARDGNPPTGFKLVASRATRRWKDEAAAVAHLAAIVDLTDEQIYAERKMRSPAQMEKVIGSKRKSEIADLIEAKSSGTILVPEGDPRPPAKADAEDEFA